MRFTDLPTAARSVVDDAIRASLLCAALGAIEERSAAPVPPERIRLQIGGPDEIFTAIAAAVFEGTLGGAADLDPMDLGPAHLALPATLAACIAAKVWGRSDERIADAVAAGMEVAARLRRSLSGIRPGAGLHSASTFGLFAASAAVARLLDLPPRQFANALGIGLTRAGGLSLNSAHTNLGLTHFGWAAGHGLEAGWLAAIGMDASLDVETAFRVLWAGSTLDPAVLTQAANLMSDPPLVFKQYPCNIYLNLIVRAIGDEAGTGIDGLTIVIPDIRHLDQPSPADVRQARNSAQGVAAIAALYPASYLSYTSRFLNLPSNEPLQRLIAAVKVRRDPSRDPGLAVAVVEVEARRGESIVLDRSLSMAELKPWSLPHAELLVRGVGPEGWVKGLYAEGYGAAHDIVTRLLGGGGSQA